MCLYIVVRVSLRSMSMFMSKSPSMFVSMCNNDSTNVYDLVYVWVYVHVSFQVCA